MTANLVPYLIVQSSLTSLLVTATLSIDAEFDLQRLGVVRHVTKKVALRFAKKGKDSKYKLPSISVRRW
jgi:hypothetical protein